jgi:hypothetical protein
MASLKCHRALYYFGAPAEIFLERSEILARRDAAQRLIDAEPSGNVLIALLDASEMAYSLDQSTGTITVVVAGNKVTVRSAPFVRQLIERIVSILGPAADKVHAEVAGGMSFSKLAANLSVSKPGERAP